jgi:hypothetical protein
VDVRIGDGCFPSHLADRGYALAIPAHRVAASSTPNADVARRTEVSR